MSSCYEFGRCGSLAFAKLSIPKMVKVLSPLEGNGLTHRCMGDSGQSLCFEIVFDC